MLIILNITWIERDAICGVPHSTRCGLDRCLFEIIMTSIIEISISLAYLFIIKRIFVVLS